MASSTLLTLVNRVLDLTGDASPVPTVVGSVGRIGERITQFLNLAIGTIDARSNWSFLRTNASGVSNGVDDVFDFTGVEDVRSGGSVSVWIADHSPLEELTAEQFDGVIAKNVPGLPLYFQRGATATGTLQVQIYPTPALGMVINISSYRRPTQFDINDDLSTTEFDDEILTYGALMHVDLYDGIDRGYAALFKDQLTSEFMRESGNKQIRIDVESYA